jgi:hypothetical protein
VLEGSEIGVAADAVNIVDFSEGRIAVLTMTRGAACDVVRGETISMVVARLLPRMTSTAVGIANGRQSVVEVNEPCQASKSLAMTSIAVPLK